MNEFDIYVARVSWAGGSKERPVLIKETTANGVVVYAITTQYTNKSRSIRSNYCEIIDWKEAGLDKQSYIDTNRTITLPLSSVDINNQVGTLTMNDIKRLKRTLPS